MYLFCGGVKFCVARYPRPHRNLYISPRRTYLIGACHSLQMCYASPSWYDWIALGGFYKEMTETIQLQIEAGLLGSGLWQRQ